jgi:hypothetical protein
MYADRNSSTIHGQWRMLAKAQQIRRRKMCDRKIRRDHLTGRTFPAEEQSGPGTWIAAKAAGEDLLREQGALPDPMTDLEAAEEVALLASLLIAYACVPDEPHMPPDIPGLDE